MFSISTNMVQNSERDTFSTTELMSKGGLRLALDLVRRGKNATVTHYNRPVAIITPIPVNPILDPLSNIGSMPVPTGLTTSRKKR